MQCKENMSTKLTWLRCQGYDIEMSWSRCTTGFATIVGYYDVLAPLPSCNELSFPFEVILSDWVFENTWCMSCTCLSAVINLRVCDNWEPMHMGWHKWIHVSTWCMFWWSTCGFVTIGNLCIWVGTRGFMWVLDVCFGDQLPDSWHWEPMHRGWHTFWLSGRNFEALFEVLCVGWIDDSEIVWCISYNHAHGYLRWQWSI